MDLQGWDWYQVVDFRTVRPFVRRPTTAGIRNRWVGLWIFFSLSIEKHDLRILLMKQLFLCLLLAGCFTATAQSTAGVEAAIRREFPRNATSDARFVYPPYPLYKVPMDSTVYPLDLLLPQALLPGYVAYRATFTNFLGHHVNAIRCVVLYDSVKDHLIRLSPLWYESDLRLVRQMLRIRFPSDDSLLNCLNQLHSVYASGSGYAYAQTGRNGDTLRFELRSVAQHSDVVRSTAAISAVNHRDEIWRTIDAVIRNSRLQVYMSSNPKLIHDKKFRREAREIIR